MKLIEDVLSTLVDAKINEIRIGLHWTAVIVERSGKLSCGLASTVNNESHFEGAVDVEGAGNLTTKSGLEIAKMALSGSMIESSIGIAAINALLIPDPGQWANVNAEHVLATVGEGKNVAIIGSFPFVKRLNGKVKGLYVFDLHPIEGEYSPEQAPAILPQMDVVAITGMTLVNKTLDSILPYCQSSSIKMMLGPSTFLTPVMYDYGFQLISGAYVENIPPALKTMSEGGTFKQVHRAGVRLVTMTQPGLTTL
jgi:uncharacterized protein (DUF4213/DUF364 family)